MVDPHHARLTVRKTIGVPEHNVIQAPEVVNRMTRALGLRQAHIVPTLSETVQPVVILHDASKEPTTAAYASFRQSFNIGLTTAQAFAIVIFGNPSGSGIFARITRIWFSMSDTARNVVAISPAAGVNLGGFFGAFSTNVLIPPLPGAVGGQRTSKCAIGIQTGAVIQAGTGDWGHFTMGLNLSAEEITPDNMVIAPGGQLTIGNTLAITGATAPMCIGLGWDEYPPTGQPLATVGA